MSIITVIFLAINIVSFLLWVKLLLKRAHDLDKSEWRIIKMSVWSLLITPLVWWFMTMLFLLMDFRYRWVSRKTFGDWSILFNLMDFNRWWKQKLFAWDLDINIKTIIDWSLWVLTLLTFLSTLYTLFVLFFKKWTDWESRFGPDPLLTQPKGDGIYWVLRLILFVVYGVLSVSLDRQSLEDTFVQGIQAIERFMI